MSFLALAATPGFARGRSTPPPRTSEAAASLPPQGIGAAANMLAGVIPSGAGGRDAFLNGAAISLGDARYQPVAEVAGPAVAGPRTSEGFSLEHPDAVPLPEPSTEASFYVLSGLVGLALVVWRRRKVA